MRPLPKKKDALKLSSCTNTISVSGTVWTVEDEEELARLVGKILLGRALHVEKIFQKLKPKRKAVDGQAAKEAKAKLIVGTGKDPWHRDGLVFQAISWIAAHQASASKTNVFSLPHLIAAHKGFDGLEVELGSKKSLLALVIFEDKATEKPRSTITSEVWPEIEKLHQGERQTELMQELAALLQKAKVADPDAVVESVVWKQIRKFRVSITGKDGQDQPLEFDKLFKGFDGVTPDLTHINRRAEVFCQTDLRKWMSAFALKVSTAIDSEMAVENV